MTDDNKKAIINFIKWCKGRFGLDDETGEMYETKYGENWDIENVLAEYEEEQKGVAR